MGAVVKTQVIVDGWIGGPGLNTFYWVQADNDTPDRTSTNDFVDQLRSMYNDLRLYMVPGMRAIFPTEHRVLDVDSGNLVGLVASDPVTDVVSSDTSALTSRATMGKFQYVTDAIRGNRLVRGGPFFGPINDAALTNTGGINPSFAAAVPTAHEGLLDIAGDARIVIYSVPVPAKDGKPARNGQRSYVQSASIWELPAVLRSRRD